MGDTNLLEGMSHYFHDKVIPNLMKLMNSPIITKNKYLASLLEYEERAEDKNTPATRKNQFIVKYNDGSIKKEALFRRCGLRCVYSSTTNSWVHRIGFRYETRKKNYVDNHKKFTTIYYNWKFVNRYIDYGSQAYRWVHLTLDEPQKYFAKFPGLKKSGY